MFGNLGVPELLLIFLVVLIMFGSKKIPEFAKGLGQGIREFKKAMRDVEETIQKEVHAPEDTSRPAARIEKPKDETPN